MGGGGVFVVGVHVERVGERGPVAVQVHPDVCAIFLRPKHLLQAKNNNEDGVNNDSIMIVMTIMIITVIMMVTMLIIIIMIIVSIMTVVIVTSAFKRIEVEVKIEMEAFTNNKLV